MFTEEEQAQNHLQLGVRYLDMGMLESARENLEIALQLDSDNEETYNALAVLSERLKQKEKARDYYQKALDINADNAS
ncbi:MAG: tetratricopeptide repeat protein, partial [Methylococcales bacterium]|nr:tetratricopeptide repeat protein [Methylococcales bacterium]